MLTKPSSRLSAGLQALFVTFLWATSWVLIKIGLRDIPALTFAGLRYSIGFYITIMMRESPLTRVQREMLATVVSAEIHCFY